MLLIDPYSAVSNQIFQPTVAGASGPCPPIFRT